MKILFINPAFYDGKEFRNRFDDYLEKKSLDRRRWQHSRVMTA